MNGYLLDTHALLWWLGDQPRLSKRAYNILADPDSAIYLSVAAAWEMTIKRAVGKLDTPDDLPQVLADNNIAPLPVTLAHAMQVGALPLHHGDPFDRLMVAQAQAEQLVLITRDKWVQRYEVPVLRA